MFVVNLNVKLSLTCASKKRARPSFCLTTNLKLVIGELQQVIVFAHFLKIQESFLNEPRLHILPPPLIFQLAYVVSCSVNTHSTHKGRSNFVATKAASVGGRATKDRFSGMKEDRFPSAEMELPVLLETHTKSCFFSLIGNDAISRRRNATFL